MIDEQEVGELQYNDNSEYVEVPNKTCTESTNLYWIPGVIRMRTSAVYIKVKGSTFLMLI